MANRYERKYLGDRHDPHYQFKDPVISRQTFTLAEEIELRQACSAALSDVPHSDDMADDPLRYLAKVIANKSVASDIIRRPPLVPLPTKAHTQQQLRISSSTTLRKSMSTTHTVCTASKTVSKRSTIKTNDSTPRTTPGITPAEAQKRFSDVGCRPSTTHSGHSAEKKDRPSTSNVYSFMHKPYPTYKPNTPAAAKSLTNLPKTILRKTTDDSVMSNTDFNQSLPSMPHKPSQARLDLANAHEE
ncbi:hypothetical protein LTR66_015589, partial [Elasticomyces elasticus]